MKYMLTHQKALKVKMGIMFGNLENPYIGLNRPVKPGIRHSLLIKLHKVYEQSLMDPCMYIKNVNNQISIILLWVEDLLIASKTETNNESYDKTELKIQNIWSWEIILVFRNTIWM